MRFDRTRRNPAIWALVIGAFLLYAWFEGSLFGDLDQIADRPGINPALAGADIGGPFSLVDHTGKPVSEKDYADKFKLVFFGYTWCPDICPTELLVIGQAMEALGDDAEKVVPLFITIDPARDTAEKLAAYVPHFHPRLVGLTGTEEQVSAAAKAYRVYYRRAEENPRMVDEDEDDAYLMDHSVYIYLMSPDDQYLQHFVRGQGPEKIAEEVRNHL